MTLVKFEPARELANISNRLKKFWEDFDAPMLGGFLNWAYDATAFVPRIDVSEDNNNLYVQAEIPGVKKEDVKLTVKDDVLTISGEKKTETRDEKKNYYRIERSSGSFCRSFSLPAEIVVDKISAEFKDGVLTITLPKTEEAKVVEKQIEIK